MKNKKLMLTGILALAGILAACGNNVDVASSGKKITNKSRKPVVTHKVTYDLNYEGAPEATTMDFEEEVGVRPLKKAPTREGREFMGWAVDAAGSDFYQFGKLITEDVTVYAKWADAGVKKFTLEAEYTPCITEADGGNGMTGSTYSGGTGGKGLIQKEDSKNPADSSNGYWVHFLYEKNANLKFEFEASEAGKATIYMRLSAEYLTPSFTMKNPEYQIKINDQLIEYSPITFTEIPEQGAGWLAFKDYVMAADVNLIQGENKIEMITNNNIKMKGTAIGLAPMVDCLNVYYQNGEVTWPKAKPSQTDLGE